MIASIMLHEALHDPGAKSLDSCPTSAEYRFVEYSASRESVWNASGSVSPAQLFRNPIEFDLGLVIYVLAWSSDTVSQVDPVRRMSGRLAAEQPSPR